MTCHHEEIRIVGPATATYRPQTQTLQRGETVVTRRHSPPVDDLVTVRTKPKVCKICMEEG